MTRMLYSLYALILLVALFAQYLPVSIATSKYHPKNSISENSFSKSNSLSLNRFKKCESSWWNNRKNLQKWSKGRKWCRNDSEYYSSRKSGKEIWSNWEKYSECRCEALDWDIRNPAGIFVCYQIAWFNKVTGKFVGELSVFQLSSRNKYKEERSHVAFKFDFKVKVHKKSHLKRDSSGYYHGISPKFSRKQDESIIQKFYVHGKISKNELIDEKILIDLLSPSKYKVIVGSKLEFKFMKNHDAVNIPFSNYLPNNPFYHVVDNCQPYPSKGDKGNTMPNDDTPSKDNPKDTPSKNNPNDTPTPNPDVEATPINTGSSATPVNSPADSSPDSSPNSSSNTSQNTINSADQDSSSSSTPSPLPGESLGVVPIGLGIFGAIIIIAIIFVLYSRYQNGKWTKRYRRRQAVRSENLVNAPGFNVGNNGSNA
ncbi:hypothetical protein C2G38_2030181 [Gigaspora rosea]|uniref:Mid2 domain-containing protein n=1 Tax=Gigaspora rosea TaxID=44941 RepID=A0A397W4Z5_9GLOM|nr:hypothetical protein C2G38_2030181 [Gigaspora rosea]